MGRTYSGGTVARRAVALASVLALLATGCGDDGDHGTNPGGAGAAGGGPIESCVDVSHVDERQVDDLEMIGTGFEAYEGLMVRILVTHGEPTYGLGEAPIQEGSFDIYLPGVLGDYTGIAVHIDSVRDDACAPDERFWQENTGPRSSRGPRYPTIDGRVLREVTPEELRVFEQAGPCNLNGVFDFTT